MASITWPSTLPAPLQEGYSESPPSNVIVWAPDCGPAHLRRRGTSKPRKVAYQFLLTRAEVATLETFFVTTSVDGIYQFNFTDPRTGSTVTARFDPDHMGQGNSPISYSSLDHNAVVTVYMEIMP